MQTEYDITLFPMDFQPCNLQLLQSILASRLQYVRICIQSLVSICQRL